MSRYKYTPEFKAKIVLEVLEGNRELGEIAADNNPNPNMVRNWKSEFVRNANRVFNERQSEKDIRRKEAELEQELRAGIREYIKEYNSERPHESHQYATPDEIYYGSFRTEEKAAA